MHFIVWYLLDVRYGCSTIAGAAVREGAVAAHLGGLAAAPQLRTAVILLFTPQMATGIPIIYLFISVNLISEKRERYLFCDVLFTFPWSSHIYIFFRFAQANLS